MVDVFLTVANGNTRQNRPIQMCFYAKYF